MTDYLKTKTVQIQSLSETVQIKELSAKAQAEFMAAHKDEKTNYLAGAIAVKYGVPQWRDKSPEEISEMLSMEHIDEICNAIWEINPPKNSESTPTDGSSSG